MVSIGIIGAGQWGLNYVRVFSELERARVSMVCDTRPERLLLVARRWPSVQVTTRLQDVLSAPSLDAVVLAVPPSGHFEVAMEAIRQGKHLLVEKPLATRTEHARKLAELAQRTRRTLMVGHVFCFKDWLAQPGIPTLKGRLAPSL